MSRYLHVEFVAQQTALTVMRGLERAFTLFGGVPHEMLFDQMKAVIVEDHRPGAGASPRMRSWHVLRPHWGFRIRACRPYRARTKGKVERPIVYLRTSFLYGRTFFDDADLAAQCATWLADVANVRIHGTTGERPDQPFIATSGSCSSHSQYGRIGRWC